MVGCAHWLGAWPVVSGSWGLARRGQACFWLIEEQALKQVAEPLLVVIGRPASFFDESQICRWLERPQRIGHSALVDPSFRLGCERRRKRGHSLPSLPLVLCPELGSIGVACRGCLKRSQ